MAFGSFSGDDGDDALAEINMIPLIDVMLVLLVIFIIAGPMLTHTLKVELPRASSAPSQTTPQTIRISISADGTLYWDRDVLAPAEFSARLKAAARTSPLPELHLNAERSTPYEKVAEVMSAAAQAGLTRIGFVTLPKP